MILLQIRRGTDAQRQTITPNQGEFLYTTDLKELWIGDGATVGGNRVSLTSPQQGSFRIKTEGDGTVNLQLWNATTSLWHTLFLTGAAGAIELKIGVGEA